jgi:predicted ATPase/class 3 adenylate cyclase
MGAGALPAGTVTFLFTDLAGSTRLLEAHPAAYRVAVRRHHALLRAAVEGHGGAVFETVGDAVYAAFARPTDAAAAALAGQLALRAEAWGEVGELRARVGLHTGEVERQGAHYFGAPLYRCARLTATAHGLQVVLSGATAELVQEALPAGAGLRDLGEHRLKDLQRPERVFQLLHPELPGDFPPLRTLDALPNNLPVQLTSFVGRGQELAEVVRLLRAGRFLTLTGAGGCGKTRLALQAAADALEAYPDGAWVAELAPLADPEGVPGAVAEALGARPEPGQPPVPALVAFLRDRRLLLVLDNCEHLLEACARLADALLRGAPGLTVLAASREALGIAGETAWRVPSLPVPPPEAAEAGEARAGHGPSPEAGPGGVGGYAAVRLFAERAAAAAPGFALTPENAPAVARICRRLDGLPLALELAAARVRVLAPDQIAGLLDDRFRLLTGGSRAALPRQQTLRAAMDWSYALLAEAERALLRRLSVFAGGCTLAAAQAVCADGEAEGEAWAVLDRLTQLVDKSLVQAEPSAGETRYRLLETVRLYARERLLESGEAAAVRDRHLAWCLALTRAPAPPAAGPRPLPRRLTPEQDNLRAALEWGLETDPGAGLELAVAGADLWQWHSRHEEARRWLAAYLARAPGPAAEAPASAPAPLAWHARARYWLGRLAQELGEPERARGPLTESLALLRRAGDAAGEADALLSLGTVARGEGRLEEARRRFQAAAAIGARIGRPALVGDAQRSLGLIWLERGDLARARAVNEAALALYLQATGRGHGVVQLRLGVIARLEGDLARARRLLEEALAGEGERADAFRYGAWIGIAALGDLAAAEGDDGAAGARYREIVAEARGRGFGPGWELGLIGLGLLALRGGDPERAARLLGALTPAQLTRTRVHAPYAVPPAEAALAACRAALGGAAFEALLADARALPLAGLAAYALDAPAPRPT